MYRQTYAQIDLNQICKNYREMKKWSQRKVGAVIKANAYGHGLLPVAEALQLESADFLMVATLDEAVMLRENGITLPVLVIGWTDSAHAQIAAEKNITLTVFQADWIREARLSKTLDIHVKIDTGMNRIGLKTQEEWLNFHQALSQKETIRVTGAFTHFATADEEEEEYHEKQLQTWTVWKRTIQQACQNPLTFHIANSAHGFRYENGEEEMVRLGISLYGYAPSPFVFMPEGILPALRLTSVVSHVKLLKKGEKVGYGVTYEAKEYEWIATIPIGYADGVFRSYTNGGHLLIGGVKRPIIGRVCMDQLMVRVDPFTFVGEEAVFIGQQGKESITADDIASVCGTISYEILCAISSRVHRVY